MATVKNLGAAVLKARRRAAGALIVALWFLQACSPPRGSAALKQGASALEDGDYGVAAQLLEQARQDLRGTKLEARALNYLGIAYYELQQRDKAREMFIACLRRDAAFVDARYNLAVICFEGGDYETAKEQLEYYTKRFPFHYTAACYLASAYLRANDTAKARALYESLEERIPKQEANREFRAQVANGLGVLAAKRGRPSEAVAFFQESLKRDPSFAEAKLNLALLYQSAPQTQKAALDLFHQFLEARPDSPQAPAARRLAEQLQQQLTPPPAPPAAAITPSHLPPTTAAPPDIRPPVAAPAPAAPSALQASTTASDTAQKMAEELNAQIKTHADARRFREAGAAAVNLGEFWLRQGNPTEAINAFSRAVNLDARNLTALTQLAQLYDAHNDPRALSLYRRAVEIDASQARSWRRIAELSRRGGEFEAAAAACRKLISLNRNDADAQFLLATILDADLKRPTEAATAYEDFASRFPNDARTAAAQQRLATLRPPPTPKRWTPRVTQAPKAGDRRKATELFGEAYRLAELNHLDAAALQYQKVIAADPSLAQAHYNLGKIYMDQQQFERAIVANETALAIQPDYLNARLNYAVALQRAGYTLDALHNYKKVLERNPNEEMAHLGLGIIYAEDPATRALARKHYERFVELAPNAPAAREVKRWLAAEGAR